MRRLVGIGLPPVVGVEVLLLAPAKSPGASCPPVSHNNPDPRARQRRSERTDGQQGGGGNTCAPAEVVCALCARAGGLSLVGVSRRVLA